MEEGHEGLHMQSSDKPSKAERAKNKCREIFTRQLGPLVLMVILACLIVPKGYIVINWTEEESIACGIDFCYDYHYKTMLILIAIFSSFFLLWIVIFFLWMTSKSEDADETVQPFISLAVLVCFIGINFVLIIFVEIWRNRSDTVFFYEAFYSSNSTDCIDPLIEPAEVYPLAVNFFKAESFVYLTVFTILALGIFIQACRVLWDIISYRFYHLYYRVYDRIYEAITGREPDKTGRRHRKRTAAVTIRKINR